MYIVVSANKFVNPGYEGTGFQCVKTKSMMPLQLAYVYRHEHAFSGTTKSMALGPLLVAGKESPTAGA
eukprot:6961169-Heterocapsa_arctica.AAC.1